MASDTSNSNPDSSRTAAQPLRWALIQPDEPDPQSSASTDLPAGSLDASISVPTYRPDTLRPSIVHVGVGGFHRAHLATYIHELCQRGNEDWAIVGAGVMPGDSRMAEALEAQGGLYTLISRGAQDTEVSIIGSIVEFIHAHPSPSDLITQIAAPATQIVSLTITEGGYPVDDVTGQFLPDSPNASPGSAFAIIVAGLAKRFADGGPPVTIMSCDNILSNGSVTRTATMGEAAKISPELVAWIEQNAEFPNSMVDRITPATSPSDIAWLEDTYGIQDRWPVVAEPFRQWVIEDHFAGRRPPLEDLDVIVTENVEPYEFMKLRLLNAGHSCLAYLAALMGIETVDTAMADAAIRPFVDTFLHEEAKPVLSAVPGIDVDDYIASLIDRFSNPQIGDQISRLCLDGSAKFPKFLMPTIRAELAVGGPIALSALALAGWCDYLNGETSAGEPIEVSNDPNLEEAIEFAGQSKENPAAFLQFAKVFDAEVAADKRFESAFVDALQSLREHGVSAAISSALSAS